MVQILSLTVDGRQQINILIPVEISSRELIYKIFLARELCLKGFNCFIGRKNDINRLMKTFKNFVYLDKGYHEDKSETLYNIIRKRNGFIVNLDEEGAVYIDGDTFRKRYSSTMFNNVDLALLWGAKQFDLVSTNFNSNNKVQITGHPRFELLKPNYKYLYEDSIKKIKARFNDYILINTNMGFGNNVRGDNHVTNNYMSRFPNIKEIINCDKLKLNGFISLISKISNQLDNDIIIRPHPEEDMSLYQKIFRKNPKVHVIYENSVIPWIIASRIMIHPDCTTAIEALILGKTPISFLPKDCPQKLLTGLPLRASVCFNSISKIRDYLVSDREKTGKISYSKKKLLDNYFNISENSMKNVVQQIVIHTKNIRTKEASKITIGDRIYFKLKETKSYFYTFKISKLFSQKISGMNLKNVKIILNKIKLNSKSKYEVEVKKISDKLYVFNQKRP